MKGFCGQLQYQGLCTTLQEQVAVCNHVLLQAPEMMHCNCVYLHNLLCFLRSVMQRCCSKHPRSSAALLRTNTSTTLQISTLSNECITQDAFTWKSLCNQLRLNRRWKISKGMVISAKLHFALELADIHQSPDFRYQAIVWGQHTLGLFTACSWQNWTLQWISDSREQPDAGSREAQVATPGNSITTSQQA